MSTPYTVAEVAELCRVSTDAVRRAIRRGDLPAELIFNSMRIWSDDLDAYREQCRVRQAQPPGPVEMPTPNASTGRGRRGSLASLQAIERGAA